MTTTTEPPMPVRGRMRLKISYLLSVEVVHSEFGTWSPAAHEMHTALREPEATHDHGKGKMVTVRASPDAWDALRRWCELHGFADTQDTFERKIRAQTWLKYQQRLRRELDRHAAAPAYRGVAVAGVCATVFQARRADPNGRWWPTIRQALDATDAVEPTIEVAELVPEVIQRRGQDFTLWNPVPVG